MGCQFDEKALIDNQEKHCIRCGYLCVDSGCVSCTSDALGASNIATVIVITRDEEGNFLEVERFWIH
jgi:RNA polymerase subunit RPABC4/transcription elongation factor Spt4